MKQILFAGDLYYDYDFLASDLEHIGDWITDKHLYTILNMEGAIKSHKGAPIKKRGPNLSSSKVILQVLDCLNVKMVCLANNHTMDFGGAALKDTFDLLNSKSIRFVGAGMNYAEAICPTIIELGKKKIAIFNYGWDVEETVYARNNSPGCAPREDSVILEQIRKYRDYVDKIVICMHWGFEYNRLPMPYDIALAHNMIECGADIIIGHHPHCVQPKEIYKGKRIYYSLGNFYFASRRNKFNRKYHEKIENQSDYGVVVVYDVTKDRFDEYLLRYDRERNESRLCDVNDQVLEDISDVDFQSLNYYRLVKRRKINGNPILTKNAKKNQRKLKELFLKYKINAHIKKIIKYKIN